MSQALLGIVERFGPGKSGPGARLRPIFQASTDKSHWIAPEEEFPNSGVVSWWQPAPDADLYRAWTFHIEPSWTYEREIEHHDRYNVEGVPTPPVELIDLSGANDPEDVRSFLLDEGIPLDRCVSKRLVFRDRSGAIIGPLDLTIRDKRLFLEEKDSFVPLSRGSSDLLLAEWDGHSFLPPENGIRRVGEVDFSSNSVFLRRVLREIKDMPLTEIETAKLTKKMIGAYTVALEKNSLNPFHAQRLKRLHKIAEHAGEGIALGEDAVPDLLSLTPVRELIAASADQAIRAALDERRAALSELDTQRIQLEEKIKDLRAEDERLRSEITSSKNDQAEILAGFDRRIHEKFEEIGKDATSFLSDVALIRAALLPTGTVIPSVGRPLTQTLLPQSERVQASHLAAAFRRRFENSGLGCIVSATLLSSWISGYVPMLFGVLARDALLASAKTLFGGSVHFVTMGPTYSSPTELSGLPATSPLSVSTVGDVIAETSRSEDLVLLVFDNANLSQIDSVLIPLIRSYVAVHGSLTTSSPGPYPTAAGMWPSNLLLAGVLIDSPLALPLSTELWACSTFIDASKSLCPKPVDEDKGEVLPLLRLTHQEWAQWRKTIDKEPTVSDTGVLAKHFLRQVDGSSLCRGMLRRLASAIDITASTLEDVRKASMLAEIAIVPYLLARGVQADVVLGESPVDLSTDVPVVERVTELFERWGLKVNRE
jgi:hypothetical protein